MNGEFPEKQYLKLSEEHRAYVQGHLYQLNQLQYNECVSYYDDLKKPELIMLYMRAALMRDEGARLTQSERLYIIWYYTVVDQSWQGVRTAPPHFDSLSEWTRFMAATPDSRLLVYRSRLLRA
jgi:hypothetical protein